jgi:hypothetical protein
MKRCPQCQADYFDEMLEFCLEDGAKLAVVGNRASAADTKVLNTDQKDVESGFFNDRAEVPQTARFEEMAKPNASPQETKLNSLKQKTIEKSYQALEVGTVVFALAHNWWQWLYVDRQSYGSVSGFLFSADFLIWLLLLLAGTTAGLLTLKFSRRKTLGYVGLIILAINFLLQLVPRR